MSDPLGRLRRFLRELKRRKVYRTAVVYAVVAFAVWQVADFLFPALGFPAWTVDFVVVVSLLGFPLALVLAWAFELTPEGVRRTASKAEREQDTADATRTNTPFAAKGLVALGVLTAAAAGGWYLMGGEPEAEPPAGDRSIAVLPFEALGQAEPDVFTEGMHDDLLARLSNISDLQVISRTTVQQYRDARQSTAEIARELGVRWILEGGVQEMGDQIQVNAQLIDPRTDTHAWADTYRRDLTAENLFDLQSEITQKIARSLEAELTPEEARRVERRPTEDLQAYRLYVQGRTWLNTRTAEGMQEAVEYFQRALEQDSSYALAWAGLADASELYRENGRRSLPRSLPDPEQAARRALELDPNLAEAHASLAYAQRNERESVLQSLRGFQRAVELKPSYAQAHHWLGNVYHFIGRLRESHEHLALAVQLNPRHVAAQSGFVGTLVAEGEIDRARAQLQQIPRDHPRYPRRKGLVAYHAGEWDELQRLAQQELRETETDRDGLLWRFYLARIAVQRGDTANAHRQRAEMTSVGVPGSSLFEGLVHAALEDEEAAFAAWSDVEERLPTSSVIFRNMYPDILDPLRSDPRYRELIREINQAWGLNPDGSLPDSVDVSFTSESDE